MYDPDDYVVSDCHSTLLFTRDAEGTWSCQNSHAVLHNTCKHTHMLCETRAAVMLMVNSVLLS